MSILYGSKPYYLKLCIAVYLTFSTAFLFSQDFSSTLDRIKQSGQINIGYRESSIPFSYVGPIGKPIGYTIDLCERIVDVIKQEVNAPLLTINYIAVNTRNRIKLIEDSVIDMECGSTTNTLSRQKRVSFLPTIFITGTQLASKKEDGITNIEDLKGKVLATVVGSTNETAVREKLKGQEHNTQVVKAKDHRHAWLLLKSGRVDASAADHVLLYGSMNADKNGKDYHVTGEFLSYDPYSIMVPRNDADFQLLGSIVLADLMRSGEIIDIYNKWFFPGVTNIKLPLSDRLKEAFTIQALPH